MQGVPQGSVLGPLLFNIYLNDLFLLIRSTAVCNFADDTTLFASKKDLNSLIKRLEHDSLLAIEWFGKSYMKLNQEKCNLLVLEKKFENICAEIGHVKIWESPKQKFLGVVIERDLWLCLFILKEIWQGTFCFSKTITLYELKTMEGFNEILYRSTIWLLPTDLDVSY